MGLLGKYFSRPWRIKCSNESCALCSRCTSVFAKAIGYTEILCEHFVLSLEYTEQKNIACCAASYHHTHTHTSFLGGLCWTLQDLKRNVTKGKQKEKKGKSVIRERNLKVQHSAEFSLVFSVKLLCVQ